MKNIKRFVNYMRRTFKNKLLAIALLVVGIVSAALSKDGTFLVFVLMISLPLFVSKKDWFYRPED